MPAAIITALSHLLGLLEEREKNKHVDRYLKLKKAHYEASNKPPELIDHAVIDNLSFELETLFKVVCEKLGVAK